MRHVPQASRSPLTRRLPPSRPSEAIAAAARALVLQLEALEARDGGQ
jgi:hypothetical protein